MKEKIEQLEEEEMNNIDKLLEKVAEKLEKATSIKEGNNILKMLGYDTLSKDSIEKIDNNIRELYKKDAICFMAVSNLGTIEIGSSISLLASLSLLISDLNEKGIGKEQILEAVKEGLEYE